MALGSSTHGPYPEPSNSLYILKRSKQGSGEIMGDVVTLSQIHSMTDVVPCFGAKANQSLAKYNSHYLRLEYCLNKYFDKETFLGLTLS